MGDPALVVLVQRGLAYRRYLTGGRLATKCDYRLTPAGKEYCRSVLE